MNHSLHKALMIASVGSIVQQVHLALQGLSLECSVVETCRENSYHHLHMEYLRLQHLPTSQDSYAENPVSSSDDTQDKCSSEVVCKEHLVMVEV